jgi:hypothetical protein
MQLAQAGTAMNGRGRPAPGFLGPSASPQNYWLALGVFYERTSLANVLIELAGGGFGAERFCVVRLSSSGQWAGGQPDTSAMSGEPGCPVPALPAGFDGLFTDLREVAGFHHDGAYVFSTGTLLDAFLEAAHGNADGGLRCPAWMTPVQCEHLKLHLGRGAAALIVRSESAPEQDASSRALLRHGRHVVWTYDFSQVFAARPAPDGE